jgi:thiosulfate dehydrogenase [quinone] large subunit
MSTMSPTRKEKSDTFALTLAMLLLRLWLAMRATVSGLEKWAGNESSSQAVNIDGAPNDYGLTETSSEKVYSLANYQGIPGPLYEKLKDEPLIPNWGLELYNVLLGPALIFLGLMILFGIATRLSLFAMGILYTSLTVGLVLLDESAGVAWLAVHIILVVLALLLAKYNRFVILDKR